MSAFDEWWEAQNFSAWRGEENARARAAFEAGRRQGLEEGLAKAVTWAERAKSFGVIGALKHEMAALATPAPEGEKE